jgi:hypothetical protein
VNHDNWRWVYEAFNCSRVIPFLSFFLPSFFFECFKHFFFFLKFLCRFLLRYRVILWAFFAIPTSILLNPFLLGPFSKVSIAFQRIKMISMRVELRRTTKEMKSETKIKRSGKIHREIVNTSCKWRERARWVWLQVCFRYSFSRFHYGNFTARREKKRLKTRMKFNAAARCGYFPTSFLLSTSALIFTSLSCRSNAMENIYFTPLTQTAKATSSNSHNKKNMKMYSIWIYLSANNAEIVFGKLHAVSRDTKHFWIVIVVSSSALGKWIYR